MTPPPTPDACENAEDNPRRFAAQSITMASSSVQAGLLVHCRAAESVKNNKTGCKMNAHIKTRVGSAGGVKVS